MDEADRDGTPSAPRTARERARREITREIKATARQHLAAVGAPALSLRAVARDLGMASSAVYRYYSSRDDLLTALIVDAYDAVGEVAETADATTRPRDPRRRWLAVSTAVRAWAVAHPHEHALVYGSPVPGYAAPEATIGPATRVPLVLLRILEDADATAAAALPRVPLAAGVRQDLEVAAASVGVRVTPEAFARAITAWSTLLGAITLELGGHLHNVVTDTESLFHHEMTRTATHLAL